MKVPSVKENDHGVLLASSGNTEARIHNVDPVNNGDIFNDLLWVAKMALTTLKRDASQAPGYLKVHLEEIEELTAVIARAEGGAE